MLDQQHSGGNLGLLVAHQLRCVALAVPRRESGICGLQPPDLNWSLCVTLTGAARKSVELEQN